MSSDSAIPLKERIDYQAPFEPVAGVLHGIGQDFETWEEYRILCREQQIPDPDLFMAYIGLKSFSSNRPEFLKPYKNAVDGEKPLLQLGLSLTHDGKPEKCYADRAAKGEYDDDIASLTHYLKESGFNSLIRIGYECCSPWNGYKPSSYISAFRRIVDHFREAGLPFASVWCVEGGWTHHSADYYPGDDWVDWISVDLFAVDHFEKTTTFMEESRERGKPVLVGECTPRRVGTQDGQQSWDKWFKPFFHWIDQHQNVKGFSYINWDWSKHEQWKDWGDARIQTNPAVCKLWFDQMRSFNSK